MKCIIQVKTCFRKLKKKVMTSDLKELENFHGEGYFEIGFEVWVRVQWGWVGLVKAN